jgi:hypothetical protein
MSVTPRCCSGQRFLGPGHAAVNRVEQPPGGAANPDGFSADHVHRLPGRETAAGVEVVAAQDRPELAE